MRSKTLFYGIFFAPVGIIAGLIIYGLATTQESKEFGWQILETATITLMVWFFGSIFVLARFADYLLEMTRPIT